MKNEKRNAERPALSSLAMIWNALQQLEVGQVGVFSFDSEPKLLHPLDAALSETAGAHLLESLTFDSRKLQFENSDYALLLDRALGYLDDCKAASSSSGAGAELQQVLCVCGSSVQYGTALSLTSSSQVLFIISDGRIRQHQNKRVRHTSEI